ncbi:MAG: hypothetical protein P4L31_04250 [Candidatus Babeliales bacterium]|nr:hypothetical protein [Candidatus Babeliales bacterium]
MTILSIHFRRLCIIILCLEVHTYASQAFSSNSLAAPKKGGSTKVTRCIGTAIIDVAMMFKNFIDWDSYKTVVATFPFFAVGQMIDESVHECFYDKRLRKNIHQMPAVFNGAADRAIVDSIAALSVAFFLFSRNQRLRETSKMFFLGLPFIGWTTNLIKYSCKSDICFRPLDEKHCKNGKKSFGGFPSTHAAQITYATVLFGSQFGVKAAVPLTIAGLFIAVPFVNGNRHYVSQLVAGAGLGVLYGLAANKVIRGKCNDDVAINIDVDHSSLPCLKLSYKF